VSGAQLNDSGWQGEDCTFVLQLLGWLNNVGVVGGRFSYVVEHRMFFGSELRAIVLVVIHRKTA